MKFPVMVAATGTILNIILDPIFIFDLDEYGGFGLDMGVKGAARSVKGFNLLKLFKRLGYVLESYGGHEMAVGFKIKKSRLQEFSGFIEQYAMESMRNSTEKNEKYFDCEIKIKDIKPRLINFLKIFLQYNIHLFCLLTVD